MNEGNPKEQGLKLLTRWAIHKRVSMNEGNPKEQGLKHQEFEDKKTSSDNE